MSNVIRSLVVKVGADLTNFDKSMKKISKDMGKVSKNLGNAGANLTKSLTLPILAVGGAMGALVMKSAETADELQRLSDVTGLSAERLQELKYAGSNLGVELETITGAQSKLTKAMFAAQGGTGKQADAFKKLGIKVTDSNGNLRDAKDIMVEAFNALNKMGNETERDATSMQLFGKSAMELNPIIKAGGDALKDLTDEARKNGAVMSNEQVSNLDAFGDSVDAMKLSIGAAAGKIAADLVPTLNKLIPIIQEKIIPAIGKFVKWVSSLIIKFSELDPFTQKFIGGLLAIAVGIGPLLSGAASLFGLIAALAGIAGASTGAAAGLLALGATLAPILAVVAAVAGIAYAINEVNEGLKEVHATGPKTSLNQKNAGVGGVKDSYYYEAMKSWEKTKATDAANMRIPGGVVVNEVNHSGTIVVKGVNNKNEFIGTTNIIMDQMMRQQRRNRE